jgi:lipopolysaccharide export LptBFGC system permease protein LptF
MTEETERARYLKDFPPGCVRKEALKQALDIRKFEIELYWKRATYFWAFIAVSFAGYFALQKDGDLASIYTVSCLGFLFSLAWYLVNRNSGAWQRNWESHVDLLEDEIMGPLYKTVINRRTYKLWHLAEPYAYSPSRINNILALGVTIAWVILIVRTLFKASGFHAPCSGTIVAMSVFTIVGAGALCWKGYSRRTDDQISIERRVRKFR